MDIGKTETIFVIFISGLMIGLLVGFSLGIVFPSSGEVIEDESPIVIFNNETNQYVCTVGVDCVCENMNRKEEEENKGKVFGGNVIICPGEKDSNENSCSPKYSLTIEPGEPQTEEYPITIEPGEKE